MTETHGRERLTSRSAFAYLWDLAGAQGTVVIESETTSIHIEREPGTQQRHDAVLVSVIAMDQELREQYLLDRLGVVEAARWLPPVIPLPTSRVSFPADLSQREELLLSRAQARAIAEHVASRLEREGLA